MIDKVIFITKEFKKYKNEHFYFFAPLPNNTRWNNIYIILKKFTNNLEKYNYFLKSEEEIDATLILNKNEIDEIFFLESFLKNFFTITKDLEKDQYYFVKFLIWLKKMKLKFEALIKEPDFKISQIQIIEEMLSSLKERFASYDRFFGSNFEAAAYINPDTFNLLNLNEKRNAKRFLVLKELLATEHHEKPEPLITNQKNSRYDYSNKFNLCCTESNSTESLYCSDFENRISLLNLDGNKFWQIYKLEFPSIFNLFLKFKAINISNGSIERKFSKTKFMSDWKRNRIEAAALKKRLMLGENK